MSVLIGVEMNVVAENQKMYKYTRPTALSCRHEKTEMIVDNDSGRDFCPSIFPPYCSRCFSLCVSI